jgi:hypothetical protein
MGMVSFVEIRKEFFAFELSLSKTRRDNNVYNKF